jgi:hypothetical protein
MRTTIPLTVLAAALACSLAAAPAHARARVFVASYGNDANPCTFGSPCKTFQQAVNVVDAGGEVTAIDSAGFGPIAINKSVTITSPEGVEAGIVPAAGGNAIEVNAGLSDPVVLRGLTLNGSSIAYNGIVFNSGANLTVANCVAENFVSAGGPTTGNGILIQPTSNMDFTITNTTASNNGSFGILYFPPSGSSTVNGVIDHVVATGNITGGIDINTTNTNGSTVFVAISNSIASKNNRNNPGGTGIFLGNGAVQGELFVSIDNVNASLNNRGLDLQGNIVGHLSRSVFTGNKSDDVRNGGLGNFFTYQNNLINFINQATPLNTNATLR